MFACEVLPAFYGAVRAVCADRWRSVVSRAGEAASVAWRRWRPERSQMKVEASVPAGQMESVLITTTQDKTKKNTKKNNNKKINNEFERHTQSNMN